MSISRLLFFVLQCPHCVPAAEVAPGVGEIPIIGRKAHEAPRGLSVPFAFSCRSFPSRPFFPAFSAVIVFLISTFITQSHNALLPLPIYSLLRDSGFAPFFSRKHRGFDLFEEVFFPLNY